MAFFAHRGVWRHPLVRVLWVCLGVIAAFGASPARAADEVRVEAFAARTSVRPGAKVPVAVVFQLAQGWHLHTNSPKVPTSWKDFDPIATEVDVTKAEHATVGRAQWPRSESVLVDLAGTGTPEAYGVFAGRAIVYLPVTVPADASGEARLDIAVQYQTCDDTVCLIPVFKSDPAAKITVRIPVSATAPETDDPARAADFAAFDAKGFDATPPDTVKPVNPNTTSTPAGSGGGTGSSFFGFSLGDLRGPTGFVLLALLGIVGGFVLNLTPCVLPVIPIKVLTLTQHAGTPGRSVTLGAWMSAGVIAFWLGLGIPAAFVSAWADPSRIFGIWWVTTAIGVLIAAMGLGIMGLFSLTLPQGVYMLDPKADSAGGSFLFGVMTAVLGLPCFGFVAGALLPGAAAIGAASTITVFAAMGVGMALPYAVLAAKPKWIERVPRTGAASELVKQVMGLLMLAAAAYFIGSGLIALVRDYPYMGMRLHWWVIALLGAGAGLWLALRTWQISKGAGKRVVFGAIGIAVAALSVLPAVRLTKAAKREHETVETARASAEYGVFIPGVWHAYSDSLAQRALASGKIVVMDFTAEWCLNCKTLKATVLDREPLRSALASDGVVLVEVDLTSTKAPGWEKLRALGQRGIPLLTVQGPGLTEPWMANAYTAEQVRDALSRARGGTAETATRSTIAGGR